MVPPGEGSMSACGPIGPGAMAIRLVVKTEPSEQWATARELCRRLKEASALRRDSP